MTTLEILVGVLIGLGANEVCDVSPWLARRLVCWAARVRYRNEPERLAVRLEELDSVSRQPVGKLIQLIVALGFAGAAVGYRIRAKARAAPTPHPEPSYPLWSAAALLVAIVGALALSSSPARMWSQLFVWLLTIAMSGMEWRRWRLWKRSVAQRLGRLVAAGVLTLPESTRLIGVYSKYLEPIHPDLLSALLRLERAAWWVELHRGDVTEPAWPGLVVTKEQADRSVVKARRCVDYVLREHGTNLSLT